MLVDTSVWVDFFNDRHLTSVVAQEVDALITERRAAITGMVLGEVLQGAADDADLVRLSGLLSALEFIEADKTTWITAARWSYELKRIGMTTPLSDLVIAAAAMLNGHSVFATDPHFGRVTGLDLHQTRF